MIININYYALMLIRYVGPSLGGPVHLFAQNKSIKKINVPVKSQHKNWLETNISNAPRYYFMYWGLYNP